MNLALKRMAIKKVGGESFAIPNNASAEQWNSKEIREKGHKFDVAYTIDNPNFDPSKIAEPVAKAGVPQANQQLAHMQTFGGHAKKAKPTVQGGKGNSSAEQIFDELQAEMQRQKLMNVL